MLPLVLLIAGCSKEKLLKPTDADINYYVNHDNPSDLVDHAIYNFYKTTGVASFYKDTIATIKVSREGEAVERFKYVTIKPGYQLTGSVNFTATPLSSRALIPDLLALLQTKVLPHLPNGFHIPCFYFVNEFSINQFIKHPLTQGMASYYGFDAIAIVVKDISAMTDDDKNMYAASILAGMARKKIELNEPKLKSGFYSVSIRLFDGDAELHPYIGLPYMLLGLPLVPAPETFAFINHTTMLLFGVMELESLPTEEMDVRGYLTMVMRYTPTEFQTRYASYPEMVTKYTVMRELVGASGFHLPQ